MNNDDILGHLILSGAAEFAAIDSETGEMLYSFTPKLKEVMPELYEEHLKDINENIIRLWKMDFISIDFSGDSLKIGLTDKAFDEQALSELSKDDSWSIKEIMRALKQS